MGDIYGSAMERDGLSMIIISRQGNLLVSHGLFRQSNIVCKNIAILIGVGLAQKMAGITSRS